LLQGNGLAALRQRPFDPGEVLRNVNSYLTRLEPNDLFVTVIYGIFDRRSAVFHYARAGHELPLLVNASGVLQEPAKSESLPIGLFPEIPLDEQVVTIPVGGTLLLFTDGMCDCRSPQGEEFGHARIAAGLVAECGHSAQDVCGGLVRTLLDFRQDAAQDDDVTLVALHRA
jgi:sigma-B regulation protein RsbU (phosphoserine phosphatase)